MNRAVLVLVLLAAPGCQWVFGPDPDKGPPAGEVREARVTFAAPLEHPGLPVPIRLDATAMDLSAVTDYKQDLRFVDDDGEGWPFEVESWDPAGECVVWVRSPYVESGLVDRVRMLYGPEAGGGADAAAVWSDEYEAVWHLAEVGATGSAYDSTLNHPGQGAGPQFEAGQVGQGRRFVAGDTSPLMFTDGEGLLTEWDELTLELYIRPFTGTWITKGSLLDGVVDDSESWAEVDAHFTMADTSYSADPSVDIDYGAWTHVVYTFDGTTFTWYQDGLVIDSDSDLANSPPTALTTDTSQLVLGGPAFEGALDEVRISRVARDDSYVQAAYVTADPAFTTVVPLD